MYQSLYGNNGRGGSLLHFRTGIGNRRDFRDQKHTPGDSNQFTPCGLLSRRGNQETRYDETMKRIERERACHSVKRPLDPDAPAAIFLRTQPGHAARPELRGSLSLPTTAPPQRRAPPSRSPWEAPVALHLSP